MVQRCCGNARARPVLWGGRRGWVNHMTSLHFETTSLQNLQEKLTGTIHSIQVYSRHAREQCGTYLECANGSQMGEVVRSRMFEMNVMVSLEVASQETCKESLKARQVRVTHKISQ